MRQKRFTVVTLLFLSTYLGYQLIDLINYVSSDKAVSFDTRVEKPEILFLDSQKNRGAVLKKYIQSPKNRKKFKDAKHLKTEKEVTKPVKKNKFLNVIRVAEDEFRYSKKDYEGEIKKYKRSKRITVDSGWEKKVLESESLIEKSLKDAALVKGHVLNLPDSKFRSQQNDMERFALKIELPSENVGTKVKLQYREPPNFGKAKLPEPISLETQADDSTFSIQKTTATESPWDNFSGPKNP